VYEMGVIEISMAIGLSISTIYILLIALLISLYLLYNKIEDPKKKNRFIVTVLLGFVLLLTFSTSQNRELEPAGNEQIEQTNWQEQYEILAKETMTDYKKNIQNTEYYDYDNIVISGVANSIALEASSAEEATIMALEYVYNHIEYINGESDAACNTGTAPEILESGEGQCDTQSIVLIALLRKMGIAAKPVGGCVVPNPSCKLQSFVQTFRGFRGPQYNDLSKVLPEEETQEISRGVSALSRSGGLHAYVVAWLPGQEWAGLEATAGTFIDSKCYDYHVEMFPEDNQKEDICVSKNWDYAMACRYNDLEGLNKEGLGLITEVTP